MFCHCDNKHKTLERCRSVEPVINPTYVLRERKNNDEIEIAHFNSATYVNVDKKRPCYENLDPPTPTTPLTRLTRFLLFTFQGSI